MRGKAGSNSSRVHWLPLWLSLLWIQPTAALAATLPDDWLLSVPAHPGRTSNQIIESNLFSGLHADVIAGRLRLQWPVAPPGLDTNETASVLASTAATDHWPARDWRKLPFVLSGQELQVDLPVEDLDVPLVYYVRLDSAGPTVVSPLRVVHPRLAGLEEPTRLFWPFLEGFEQGFDSWRLLDLPRDSTNGLTISPAARIGHQSLRLEIVEGGRSVRVATTRVRGWQLLGEGATGLRFWARTEAGTGSIRCSLRAHAFTSTAAISTWPDGFVVGESWTRVDLPFRALSAVRWRGVDLFVIQFEAPGPAVLLLDELQFLGPWKLQPE